MSGISMDDGEIPREAHALPSTDLNITMFQSGYGDGVYPVYFGLDESGEIVSVVIDFFVLLLEE